MGARAEAEALLKQNPGLEAVGAIGDLRMRTGDQEGAAELFRRIIGAELRSGWAHAELREACEELGQTQCASHERAIQSGELGH